jgi:TRAP-type mannitol/chloroaromatic compound transport system permease small subunit
MPRWSRLARGIDALSERTGTVLQGLTLVMVLIGAFNAIARYLDKYTGLGLSSNTWLELQWYLFSAVFLLGAAYTLKRDAHVRVDVFYGRLSRRGQAWIDLLGTVFLLVPFCLLVLWMSWDVVLNSWAIWEQSPDPGGLPRYPVKTLVPLALLLVLLQGVSMAIHAVAVLRGDAPAEAAPRSDADPEAASPPSPGEPPSPPTSS